MGVLNNNILGNGSFAITENLDMNDFQINNLADPTSPQDAVTKQYADDLALDAGDVNSVFGRAGTVIAETGDYTASQITDIGTIIEPTELTDADNPYYLIFVSQAASTTPYINSNIIVSPSSDPGLIIGDLEFSSAIGISAVRSNNGSLMLSAQGGGLVAIDGTNLAIWGGNSFRLYDNNNENYVALKAPDTALTSDFTLTLPSTAGSSGYILSTDGSGNLSWISVSSSPTGSAGGDLDGTYPNPTVAKINGAILGDTTANEGNILVASSDGIWVSVAMHGDIGLDEMGSASIQPNVVTTDMLIGTNSDTSSVFVVTPTQFTNTGEGNTAFGFEAFQDNVVGVENCAFGWKALNATYNTSTTGYSSAFGSNALANQTTGENDAFGEHALFNTTTGTNNVAVGGESLNANIIGGGNVGVGAFTLFLNLANDNTGIGYNAAASITTGSNNIAIGSGTGNNLITGSNNTLIGSQAEVGSANLSNASAFGYNAVVNISDAIVLGSGCSVGIGTSSPGYTLHIVGDMLVTDTINGTVTNVEVNPVTADNIYYPTFTLDHTTLDYNTNLIYTISGGIGTLSTNALKLSVNTGLQVKDPTSSFLLTFKPNSTLTNYRTLSFTTGDSDRNLTFTADATIGGTNSGDVTLAGENYLSLSGQVITAADINLTSNVTGILPLANGGTNANLSATGGSSQVLQQTTIGAAITVGQLSASNLSNGITGSGTIVLAASPTLINPILGIATATSINSVYSNLINTSSLVVTTSSSSNTGSANAIFGYQAFNTAGIGDLNSAFGYQALKANTDGTENCAFGIQALLHNTTGFDNSAFGPYALKSVTTANNNNAFGNLALTNTTGSNNSAFGSSAGDTNTSGSSNTFIGYNTDAGSNNLSNATAIGANATVNTSNSLVLGNSANVGIGNSSPTYKLDVSGDINSTGIYRVSGTQIAASNLSNGTTGTGAVVLATSPTLVTPALGTPSALVGTNITGTAASLTAGTATNATNIAVTNTSALGRSNIAFINASSGNATINVDDLNLNYNSSTATFRLGNNNNATAAINLTTSLGVNNTYGSGSTGVTNVLFAGAYNGGMMGLVSNGAASAYNGIPANNLGIYLTDKDFSIATNAGSGSTYTTAFTINNVNRTCIFGAGVRHPVTVVSGTYTALITDYYLAVDTSAARTITLPSASAVGIGFTLIIYDSTGAALTNNVTINRAGSDTINGATSKALSLNYSSKIFVVNTSSTWYSAGWTGS